MNLHEPTLKPATFEQWMEALESGRWPKTTGYLHDDRGYCCLGVLADIEGVQWEPLECEEGFRTTVGEDGDVGQATTDWQGTEGGDLPRFLSAASGSLDPDGDHMSNASLLVELNDDSATFAPVIAKARELYAAWKQAQA